CFSLEDGSGNQAAPAAQRTWLHRLGRGQLGVPTTRRQSVRYLVCTSKSSDVDLENAQGRALGSTEHSLPVRWGRGAARGWRMKVASPYHPRDCESVPIGFKCLWDRGLQMDAPALRRLKWQVLPNHKLLRYKGLQLQMAGRGLH